MTRCQRVILTNFSNYGLLVLHQRIRIRLSILMWTSTRQLMPPDLVILGGSPLVMYSGNLPAGGVPPWMKATYDVWYRDPCVIVKNLLSNPDFKNEFDYSPVQEYDTEGNHRFHDFMTGNWAWHQAVCSSSIVQC